MSTFTHRNLTELDDAAASHDMGEGYSARFARVPLDCEDTGFALQRLEPNAKQPFAHHHEHAEEVYVVIAGSGRMLLNDEVIELADRDAVRVSPGVTRSLAAGPDGLEFLVFGPHREKDGAIVPVEWPS